MCLGWSPIFPDVSGDRIISPLDALLVINYLRQPIMVVASEGEGRLSLPSTIISGGHRSVVSDIRRFDETIDGSSPKPTDDSGSRPATTMTVNHSLVPTPQEAEEDISLLDLEAALQLIAEDIVKQ